MTRVNLLPWREALRKERQKNFFISLGLSVILAALSMGGVYTYIEGLIDQQERRKVFLNQQIRLVNTKIGEIKKLDDERSALLNRMHIIQRLQTSRPEMVHLFDAIVRLLPDGVYLTSLQQKSHKITIQGVAQSNARVSSFMRNLDNSKWLTDPKLDVIKNVEVDGPTTHRVAEFVLKVTQVNPQAKKSEAGEQENENKRTRRP